MIQSNEKKAVQAEETTRKPMVHIVVGVALLVLAVALLLRGIKTIRITGFSFGVLVNFIGTLLFAVVGALMMSDLLKVLREKFVKDII